MNQKIINPLEAVITSYNQKEMIVEALQSILQQTYLPKQVHIVDDGSQDQQSIDALKHIQQQTYTIPVEVIYQKNAGVSAARNIGIAQCNSAYVLVLDGDDKLAPTFIESVLPVLMKDENAVGASSYMHTFGFMNTIVKPTGGMIQQFLSKNCCCATHILKKEVWKKCGGYDESMRSGFEDWDFFLSMLETREAACILVVDEPLIYYRTAPASSNIRSMEKRLELMKDMIQKHHKAYTNNIVDVLLGIEATSMNRLSLLEDALQNTLDSKQMLSDACQQFMDSPSYGDGGMAAAVRIQTFLKKHIDRK